MPLKDLLWACPACGSVASVGRVKGADAACSACDTAYRRVRGAHIEARRPGEIRADVRAAADWVRLLPPIPFAAGGGEGEGGEAAAAGAGSGDVAVAPTIREARVESRTAIGELTIRQGGEFLGRVERLGPRRGGTLRLSLTGLEFQGDDGATTTWQNDEITALQPSSSTLQIKARGRPVVSFRFPEEPLRLWEELIALVLRRHCRIRGAGEIIEFQPRIALAAPGSGHVPGPGISPDETHTVGAGGPAQAARKPGEEREPAADVRVESAGSILNPGNPTAGPADARAGGGADTAGPERVAAGYRSLQRLVTGLWRRLAGLRVDGAQNVPERGPFILLPNHQSILDPILVGAACPRPLHVMAKSTQFVAPVVGAIMVRYHSFPVRRYQVDPQSVRLVLRRLAQGHGVGIYPEGERSWDGRLQPFRLGTVRVVLKAGVPVVPCVIQGSYEAWPRWDRRMRLHPVRISFGEPLRFPRLDRRADREAALPDVLDRLQDAFLTLLDTP